MAFVYINPRFRDSLHREGLTEASHFLKLPMVIVCGHPDRHVARVHLGAGPAGLSAFLKREHRVSWKERLANAWAGFGWVSRSGREAALLRALRQAGIGCPELVAAGEDGKGQAFLMVRELAGAQDLRVFLRERLTAPPDQRRRFARRLGQALARLHAAGFDHPDLYSKHVLVGPGDGAIRFLDWQRSRRWPCLGWSRRCRDLAALDATLADELAGSRDRLACLRAYLRCANTWESEGRAKNGAPAFPPSHSLLPSFSNPLRLARVVRQIRRESERLQRRRHIQELRQPPLPTGTQNLVWLDGEALCVTSEFRATWEGRAPGWLPSLFTKVHHEQRLSREVVPVPGAGGAHLVRRWASGPLGWLWSRLRGRPLRSPEVEQAATLFRLQRYGVRTPRLLAFGERHSLPWRTESFLLTEPTPESVPLDEWLANRLGRPLSGADRRQCRQVIRETATLLRRMHQANCYLFSGTGRGAACPLLVQPRPGQPLAVVLGNVEGIRPRRRSSRALAMRDLTALEMALAGSIPGRTDHLRFLLGYLNLPHLTPAGKRMARLLRRGAGRKQERRRHAKKSD